MQQFRSIHYLRAVAALLVVILHAHISVDFMRAGAKNVDWMRCGVDIFFVISGFVMVKSTEGRNISPREFFARRCERIIPIYWIATFAVLMSMKGEWLFKLASFAFIPMINPKEGLLQPIMTPGWTLNYEMFFYALFAGTLLLRENYRFWSMAAMLSVLVALRPFAAPLTAGDFYTNSILLEFLMGMAIARFGLRAQSFCIPLAVAAMYLLPSLTHIRLLYAGIPAGLLVMAALTAESRLPKIRALEFLGDASYSIYLFHLLALGLLVQLWPALALPNAMFVPVGLAVVVIIAGIVHLLLERPLTNYFARRRRKASADEQSPSPPLGILHVKPAS